MARALALAAIVLAKESPSSATIAATPTEDVRPDVLDIGRFWAGGGGIRA